MDAKKTKTANDFRMSLHGLPYDRTVAAEPPVKITSIKSPPQTPSGESGLETAANGVFKKHNNGSAASSLRARSRSRSRKQSSQDDEHSKNPNNGTAASLPRVNNTFVHTASINSVAKGNQDVTSQRTATIVPQIMLEDDPIVRASEDVIAYGAEDWPLPAAPKHIPPPTTTSQSNSEGLGFLKLDLPGGGLGDELQVRNMKFSQRGSMFIDGRKVNSSGGLYPGNRKSRPAPQRIVTSSSVPDNPSPRMMSTDEEVLSEKVRSCYAVGQDVDETSIASRMGSRWQDTVREESDSLLTNSRRASTNEQPVPASPGAQSLAESNIVREENELAGGLEDWQDIDNADVDRYGFIVPKSPTGVDDAGSKRTPSGNTLQRVSTSLQLASEAPRRKHTIRRAPSSAHADDRPKRKGSDLSTKSNGTRPATARSAGTVGRNSTVKSSSRLNGRERRLMNEAADMFTLPRSLTSTSQALTRTTTNDSDRSIASQATASKMNSTIARKKEVEREEKWRKMAKPIPTLSASNNNNNNNNKTRDYRSLGTTLLFSFPAITDPKLISRTWKGIPDSWRAQAWHYFLSVSAAKHPSSLPDDKLINLFHDYQTLSSPDDVQIDIDVPRTINSHIMFRRRYRGGQRLLFRVLHAMSLHWPDTGYVQGMAALAATLLSYYEEEKAFVILVRLWDVRGLGRLYEREFGGLLEALDQFEKGWLGDGEVAKKLHELNIFPTAYGTKWYLTLFNYSVPFPAQLRIWDVFILLGDDEPSLLANNTAEKPGPTSTTAPINGDVPTKSQHPPLGTTLDVLHATAAALIDGMRDILLESDFENAMKVLTSWIPIRDEDLFMRVAKAEWKIHRKKIAG